MVAVRENELLGSALAPSLKQDSTLSHDVAFIFQATMVAIKRKLSLFVWQGFFEPLVPVSIEDDLLTIAAPSLFHRDWIHDHYLTEIAQAACAALERPIRVRVVQGDASLFQPKNPQKVVLEAVVQEQTAAEPSTISPLRSATPAESVSGSANLLLESNQLNSNYIFDTFVPGPSNQMAFAACNAVSEQPGSQYSPLFLFGPVGLGKTHLLHAIGLSARARNPNMRVLYMSAEQWVNAYIQAIRERCFELFRKKFRSCDMLLIDDIQFLAGKDASQDEFFHTFNALHQAHKQIVVTSDKYPHEIEGLEERLKTRLAWGLIADIQPPEMETRIAILHRKAESCKIRLPDDVAHFLASQVTSSVRELEGALLRLSAFASMSHCEISLQQARDYLSPVFRRSGGDQISSEKICETVASYYDLRSADLKGQSRQKPIAFARQIAMWLCRAHLSMSLPEIGRLFGGRDHTTVLSSLRKIGELRESDVGVQSVIVRLEKTFLGL